MVTALLKVISATGRSQILEMPDPLFGLENRLVLYAVSVVELGVVMFLLFSRDKGLKPTLIAWLSSCFFTYHFGLALLHLEKPCPCLGNLTDALHVPARAADIIMKIILTYLLIGSYATLFWLWRQKRKAEGGMKNDEVKGSSEMEVGS